MLLEDKRRVLTVRCVVLKIYFGFLDLFLYTVLNFMRRYLMHNRNYDYHSCMLYIVYGYATTYLHMCVC